MPSACQLRGGVLVAVGLVLWASPCWSAPSRASVSLVAAPEAGCPTQEQAQAQVAACMRSAPAGWTCPSASATVTIRLVGRQLEGTLAIAIGDRALGARTLRGDGKCASLVAAAALATCIGLDAMCRAPQTAGHVGRRPRHAAPRTGRRDGKGRLPGSPLRLSIAALGSRGAAPSTSAGLTLSASVPQGRFRFGVEGRVDAPASGPFQGGTIGSSLAVGGLSLCADHRRVGLCLVQYAGFKHVFGLGFAEDQQHWLSYFGTSLRAVWTAWRRRGLGAALWVQADLPWIRDKLQFRVPVTGGAPLVTEWTTPRVGLTMGVEFFLSAM